MANRFHKLRSDSEFPLLGNVDVYKYDNDFDYSRYVPEQMNILMCDVPWDMGEAHIGNRTISGIGNVVYFGSAAARDAWFDSIPDDKCCRFSTKYKELHRDLYIDVPVPFDVCAKYNYIAVSYSLFANDDSPVMYEHDGGVRKWFWFIREVEFLAANNTRLHILDDAFQTWIYDVNVSGMVLERGHAPMFATKVDAFLQNPVENNANLLTEDVTFGEAGTVRHVDALALNAGTMFACIASTANARGNWGTKAGNTWHVPTSSAYQVNGQPSVAVFAMPATELNAFLVNVTSTVPQFKQTIQGVFFASSDLITLGDTFEFAGTTCYMVYSSRKRFDLCRLSKSQFGYPAAYADIAKLYTSPYAHIEITDENGNVDIVKVEDSTGEIDVSAALSLAYPFVTIDAHLLGVGGSAGAAVTYRNVTAHTFDVSGQWYETLRSWEIPTFAVVLSPETEYDYGTHFTRAQRVVDYTTEYDNSTASAATVKANADDKANAAKTGADASADAAAANTATIAAANKANADANGDLTTANALLTTTANTAITNISNGSATQGANNTQAYNFAVYDADNAVISQTASSQIQAAEQQAAIGAASAAASGVVGAIASAATGNIAGAVSSAVNGVIGGASTLASTAVSVHLQAAEAQIAQDSNEWHGEAASDKTDADLNMQTSTATSMTGAQNTLTSGQAANSSATTKANATRSQTAENAAAANTQSTEKANNLRNYNTETANNLRTYNTDTANAGRTRTQAISSIANDTAQAALREPFIMGNFANGNGAANKPIALFANIVTQSKSAIRAAGDEFLRYGYALDMQWPFDGNWNVGKYFTYWKLRDFWVSDLQVPDMYMDKLRFFLFGGVTVWRRPEDIGKKTIYENFNG